MFGGWPFGPVVAFGAAAGEPSGLPRSGPLPAFNPVVLSRIPELVMLPLLPLVMPLVKVLPRTPACEVGRLCVVCCAIAVVPNKASRPTARVIFFIASSTERSPTDGFSVLDHHPAFTARRSEGRQPPRCTGLWQSVTRNADLAIPAADQNQRSRPDELEAIYNHRRNMHPELIVCPSLPGEMGSLHLDPSGDGRLPGGP